MVCIRIPFVLLFCLIFFNGPAQASESPAHSQSQFEHDEKPAGLYHMWATPLSIQRPKINNLVQFNKKLADRILVAYNRFLVSYNKIAVEDRLNKFELPNDAFFAWQQHQHQLYLLNNNNNGNRSEVYRDLISSNEWKMLIKLVESHIKAFYDSIGKDLDQMKQDLEPHQKNKFYNFNNIFAWATVGSGGSYHLPHSHADSSVSGVYYVNTPPGSGAITFEDPRSSGRYPFDGRLILTPRQGELLLFPGWLMHSVLPSMINGESKRISIAFNLDGKWEDTTDVSIMPEREREGERETPNNPPSYKIEL